MRKDAVSLLKYAAELGFPRISVVTNGMLLGRHLKELAEIEALLLHISIDGPEPVHDRLRGAGSYQKAVEGARAAISANIPVTLKSVFMRPTMAQAQHLLDLAEELGVARISIQPFQPEIAGPNEDHSEWVFPSEEREIVWETLSQLLDEARLRGIEIYTEGLFPEFVPYLFDGHRPIPKGGCYLPSRFLLIDGRGETFPCFFMRGRSYGNVTRGVRLTDIWHGPVQQSIQAQAIRSDCPGCLAGCSDVASYSNPRTELRSNPDLRQALL